MLLHQLKLKNKSYLNIKKLPCLRQLLFLDDERIAIYL